MKITYLNKSEMLLKFKYPYFGYTNKDGIWVLSDLPIKAKISVLAHEKKHWDDKAFRDDRIWYWEVRAWWAAFKETPAGFIQAIYLSITDADRLKLYIKRVVKHF